MKRKVLTLALLAAGLIGGTSTVLLAQAPVAAPKAQVVVPADVPDPAIQIENWARLFRAGNVTALAQALVPPSKWEQARLVYELKRLEPTSAEDRAEFTEKLEQVLAPDAVDRYMAEIEPELEKARPQAAGAMLMAFGAMQLAVTSPESKLSDEQRAVLQAALPGVQEWASGTDFLSSDTMRQALTLLTDAARRTGLTDLDQIKALPLEGVLDRVTPLLAAAKQAVRLYGLDLDTVADSLQVDVLEIDGVRARVRTTVTLFGSPVWHEHELQLVEGRWYGKDAVIQVTDPDEIAQRD